ncbi:hypothetical protein RIF29_24456 [Crotalaria pallida]|uniref:Serine-threonine/tyrosine-protein kinase catalytic domain-containing protein n=1 Tax=Crotalaria pallida TaxID=3830 RepID=A0AAN9EKG8_CROPI
MVNLYHKALNANDLLNKQRYFYDINAGINKSVDGVSIDSTGRLSVKSDVYNFGVVLLEMLTGMSAIDTKRPTGQHSLVAWVKPHLCNEKVKTIMDDKIEGQYSFEAALQAAQLSLKCLEYDPENRPSMIDVLDALEAIKAYSVR